jgi:hypothetical protein
VGILRQDPRDAVIAQLNRLREERLDADPDRHAEITEQIDRLLEKLRP